MLLKRLFMLSAFTVAFSTVGMMENVSGHTTGHTFTLTCQEDEKIEGRLHCDPTGGEYLASGCPQGYVPVPGNRHLGTTDFCVMATEAKKVGGVATSQAERLPWTSIHAHDAYDACKKATLPGYRGQFALISNPEWMTIARDIENNDTNWSGGRVGVGMISSGHSDEEPYGRLEVSDSTNYWSDTNNDEGEVVRFGWEQRRAHTLSNESVIWDLAGNVWEWVDWRGGDKKFTLGPTDVQAGSGWRELDEIPANSVLSYRDLSPQGSYTSEEGMGRWYGGYGGAAIRGGRWNLNTYAGVFYLSLYHAPTNWEAYIGFRCVFRPE